MCGFAGIVRNDGRGIEAETLLRMAAAIRHRGELDPKLHDYQTPQFSAVIPAGQTSDLLYEVTVKQGINAKQSNVTIEEAAIKP